MAFGFQPRGLFGRKPMTGATMGGFGGGTFNMDGTRVDEPEWLQPSPQQQMSKPGGGLFGKVTGAMGDIGSILDDSPSGMQAREMEYRQQQDRSRAFAQQQQAEAENAQWYEREKWKRDNPEPGAPDAFDRALQRAGIDPASEQGVDFYRRRAEAMARDPSDEFVIVPVPGRGTYAGPKSGLPSIFGARPAAKPFDPNEWEPVAQGDAGSNASGGFREAFSGF